MRVEGLRRIRIRLNRVLAVARIPARWPRENDRTACRSKYGLSAGTREVNAIIAVNSLGLSAAHNRTQVISLVYRKIRESGLRAHSPGRGHERGLAFAVRNNKYGTSFKRLIHRKAVETHNFRRITLKFLCDRLKRISFFDRILNAGNRQNNKLIADSD